MNDHPIRIGVVGAGYWGPNLIRQCAELGVLDSVCDTSTAALDAVRRTYPGVTVVTDFEVLLKRDIHGVIIAAPAELHATMGLQAIHAKKHVFVEKPLALSVAEGEHIADAADSEDVMVFVGHVLLYHPAIKKTRSLILEGAIGQIKHLRSRRLSLGKLRSHESAWWSFAPHDVALMLAIMDEEPFACSAAQADLRGVGLCDAAYADYRFSGERSAHLEVCWLDPEKSARLDIFGTSGVLTFVDSRHGSTLALKRFTVRRDHHGQPVVERGAEERITFSEEEPLKLEIQQFIQMIARGSATESSARHGVAVLKALSMADGAAGQIEVGSVA